jgi:hypothetical protein
LKQSSAVHIQALVSADEILLPPLRQALPVSGNAGQQKHHRVYLKKIPFHGLTGTGLNG